MKQDEKTFINVELCLIIFVVSALWLLTWYLFK